MITQDSKMYCIHGAYVHQLSRFKVSDTKEKSVSHLEVSVLKETCPEKSHKTSG